MKKTELETLTSFQESFDRAVSQMKDGYVIAMMTDAFVIQRVGSEEFDRQVLFDRGLEIRVFDRTGEIKWFRSSIDKNFMIREIHDEEDLDMYLHWDEAQYLDIDETASDSRQQLARATGGGTYPLPIPDYRDAMIMVRNYIAYEEDTMQSYIEDWRLMDFIGKGGE